MTEKELRMLELERQSKERTFEEFEEDFKKYSMFSKDDVLKKIDKIIFEIENDIFIVKFATTEKEILLNSLREAYSEFVHSLFPDVSFLPGFWSYNIQINITSIDIYITKHIIDVDKKIYAREQMLVYRYDIAMLSVNEYSNKFNVAKTTVRDWIRRGKLSNVKKNGSDWLIPSLVSPTFEKSRIMRFKITKENSDLVKEFPFMKGAKYVLIRKIKSNRNYYITTFYDDNKTDIDDCYLDTKKAEIFILKLLSLDCAEEESDDVIYYV